MRVLHRITVIGVLGAGFGLAQTARVEGSVRTLAGAPVPRATIQLVNTANGTQPAMRISGVDGTTSLAGYTAMADDQGKFVVDNVPPGRNYRLSAMRPGFVTGFYGTRSDANPPVLLTLNAGDVLRDLTIEMTEQGVITGRVTEPNGDPVTTALVTLAQSRYVAGVRQMVSVSGQPTDDRGAYRFANLNPGRYYIRVVDNGNRLGAFESGFVRGQEANIRTYYPSVEDERDARPIDIPESERQSTDIVMRRAHTFALRGKVMAAETGEPLTDLTVRLERKGFTPPANPVMRQSGPDGAFFFSGLPPGEYAVEVVQRGTNVPDPSRRAGRVAAVISNADVTELMLRADHGADVEGSVRMDTGDFPDSFFSLPRQVILRQDAPERAAPRWGGRIERDGKFRMVGLPPLQYVWGFTALPEDVYVKSVKFGDAELVHSLVDLTAGKGGSLTIVLSSKPATLNGFARNEKGEAMKSVAVTLWPKQVDGGNPTGGIRRAVTDQNGAFHFAGLAPGEYYLAGWQGVEDGLLDGHEFVSRFNGDAVKLNLSEGANVTADAKVMTSEKVTAEIAKLR